MNKAKKEEKVHLPKAANPIREEPPLSKLPASSKSITSNGKRDFSEVKEVKRSRRKSRPVPILSLLK
ncbi:Hypothetical protein FKW44_010216 [Caligus rogercresseyi]|uniref:Uncharacterized protein n=1 Tax=Caligus rogercresseyi TaxID=217165 RepID=A0A7T8HGE4_CALRO|nr:Hypothetical protein FKW44_010216 [Caligus rogercresseyi]